MVLRAVLRPVYLALFSLTLLAVIVSSGAAMAIAGLGRDVFIFTLGLAVGTSLVSALSLERWHLLRAYLREMQADTIKAIAAVQLREINPQLLLSQYSNRTTQTPHHASDVQLELECRRLLDRLYQLLEKTEREDGSCRYCTGWDEHTNDCPIPAARSLYQQGKARRIPWREYKKSLPQDAL